MFPSVPKILNVDKIGYWQLFSLKISNVDSRKIICDFRPFRLHVNKCKAAKDYGIKI